MTTKTTNIETEPLRLKSIILDSALKGSSSPDSNFQELVQPYSLKSGKSIMGTKSVVINAKSFFRDFQKNYNLSTDVVDSLHDKISEGIHKESELEGYVSYFWDNTSEVHHRDIMLNYFKNFSEKLSDIYESKLENVKTEKDLEEAIILEESKEELNYGIRQLYETKKGGKHNLNNLGKMMLKYSQGYQLSLNEIGDNNSLWTCQIRRLEVDSGITKDQIDHNISIPVEETLGNIKYFLNKFENMEFKTNSIEMPKKLGYVGDYLRVKSVPIHKNCKGEFISKEPRVKDLRINYK